MSEHVVEKSDGTTRCKQGQCELDKQNSKIESEIKRYAKDRVEDACFKGDGDKNKAFVYKSSCREDK